MRYAAAPLRVAGAPAADAVEVVAVEGEEAKHFFFFPEKR